MLAAADALYPVSHAAGTAVVDVFPGRDLHRSAVRASRGDRGRPGEQYGLGYSMATSEGEVIPFGDARPYGDIFSVGLNGHLLGPVVGVLAFPRELLPPPFAARE
jgi:hypothetical protein